MNGHKMPYCDLSAIFI